MAYNGLAMVYAKAGNFDDAKRWLTKSLELAPPEQREAYRFLQDRFKSGHAYPLK